uniref:BHLH domain-containing protein n=1 Tax=Oryza rufipogon TaxID=4529 RepID=A0A0E0RJL3_ORYRU
MEMTSCYNDVDAGDMFAAADYYSAGAGGDLFDMVWPGRRRREEDNTSGCLPLSPPPPPELAVDDQLPAGGDGGGGEPVAVAVAEDDDSGERWTEDQVPTDEGICVMKRRCKINENLKTLQQLVPVCDKSNNQASTLDKTIRYMKSLQQHAQHEKTAAAAGVTCPFLPPPPSSALLVIVEEGPTRPWDATARSTSAAATSFDHHHHGALIDKLLQVVQPYMLSLKTSVRENNAMVKPNFYHS